MPEPELKCDRVIAATYDQFVAAGCRLTFLGQIIFDHLQSTSNIKRKRVCETGCAYFDKGRCAALPKVFNPTIAER